MPGSARKTSKSGVDGDLNLVRLFLVCLLLTTSAFGQLTARNPVDELKDQVTQALAEAKVPFTPDQEKRWRFSSKKSVRRQKTFSA